jgi:hypothetical protein
VEAEPVLPGVGVLLDEAAAGEGLEQPVGRRLRDAQAPGDVGDPQLTVEGEALEDVEGTADRLEARAAQVLRLRPLRGRGTPRLLLLEDDRHAVAPLPDGSMG